MRFDACRRDGQTTRVERRAAPLRCAIRAQPRHRLRMFGISTQALFGQLLIGLINGAFYAILRLGSP